MLVGEDQMLLDSSQQTTWAEFVVKLDADGQVDTSFAGIGRILLGFGEGAVDFDINPHPRPGDEGAFLIDTTTGWSDNKLTRYHADASVDTTFGQAGTVDLNAAFGGGFPSYVVLPAPDGKIYVDVSDNQDLYTLTWLGRLNADGSVDENFGSGGAITFTQFEIDGGIQTLDVDDPQGGVLGLFGDLNDAYVFHLTPSGQFDATFDDDGIALPTADVSTFGHQGAAGDSQGRVLLADANDLIRLTTRDPISLDEAGILHIDGTGGDDAISVAREGDEIIAHLNDGSTTFPASDVVSLLITGAGGVTDTIDVTVDLDARVTATADTDIIHTAGGNDSIACGGGTDIVDAGGGDDTIFGGLGSNLLKGGDGDDRIDCDIDANLVYGGAGNDTLNGAMGYDKLLGDAGDDSILGQEGNDTLFGGEGNETIFGDDGRDKIFGEAGSDLLAGNADADLIDGGSGADRLAGNGSSDKLYGGGGNDRLYGGDGRDYLYGQAGNDQLFGDGGNDHLNPGGGADTAHGGAGDDTFIAADSALDALFGDRGRDTAIADAADLLAGIESAT